MTPAGVVTLAAGLFTAPLPLEHYWLWLLLPLVAGVSIVYKAIKLDDLTKLPWQAFYLFVQILLFMLLAAALIWLIVELAS